jgi:hypothetical protein
MGRNGGWGGRSLVRQTRLRGPAKGSGDFPTQAHEHLCQVAKEETVKTDGEALTVLWFTLYYLRERLRYGWGRGDLRGIERVCRAP